MSPLRTSSRREYASGALIALVGFAAAFIGASYPIGTLSRMGPGLFPVAIALLLVPIGVAIGLSGKNSEIDEETHPPEWRGWFCIGLSLVAFVTLGEYGGLVPATFAIVFIAALADRQNTVLTALLLASVIVLICIVVFWWALQLPFPLFRWG